MSRHLTEAELQLALPQIRQAPQRRGQLKLIVARPRTDERLVLEEGQLTAEEGLQQDNWLLRGSKHTEDGSAHPDMQITLMNARVIAAVAEDEARWALAGDQLYVDLDLSVDNLPPGTRLALGSAVLEVTEKPHNGCRKFSDRFGQDAVRWMNSPEGKKMRLRGMYARVVQPGTIRVGDVVQVLTMAGEPVVPQEASV